MTTGTVISYVIAVAIVLIIAKIFFKGTKAIIGFLINAAVGAVALWVLDLLGLGVPITWLTAAIPGVIIVCLLKFVFHVI